MRLIDADDLPISSIDMTDVGYYVSKYGQGIPAVYLEDIEDAHTIEPRKTGKWIPHREKRREYIGTVLVSVTYDYWFCDTCGYRVENGQPMYNFCPNCGADMRGEQNDS